MKTFQLGLLLLAFLTGMVQAGEDDWVIGRWELSHDPDGAQKDWLEFTAEGDVYSISPDGERTAGIYIVAPDSVKTVFTYNGQDVIATFHFDRNRGLLTIVTSESGEASIYSKVHADHTGAP